MDFVRSEDEIKSYSFAEKNACVNRLDLWQRGVQFKMYPIFKTLLHILLTMLIK